MSKLFALHRAYMHYKILHLPALYISKKSRSRLTMHVTKLSPQRVPIKSNSRLWCGPTSLQNFAPTTRTFLRYEISRLWCAPISTKTFSCLQFEPLYVAYFSAYSARLYTQNLFPCGVCVYTLQNLCAPICSKYFSACSASLYAL